VTCQLGHIWVDPPTRLLNGQSIFLTAIHINSYRNITLVLFISLILLQKLKIIIIIRDNFANPPEVWPFFQTPPNIQKFSLTPIRTN
jgi:hypothetical protein